jgi:phage shock protein PspC (stress-responsive transcriptional regulator)
VKNNFKVNLYKIKSKNISVVGGVLAGIAYEYGFQTWKIRVPCLLLFIFYYTMPYITFLYFLGWIFLEKKEIDEEEFFTKTKQPNKFKK